MTMREAGLPCTVLVVERDAETRRLIRTVFARRGIRRIDEARDATDALHNIASTPYALVLLDVTIPDGSGFDLLYSIGALARGLAGIQRWLPDIVVLSALPGEMKAERLSAIAPGLVKAILRKPIDARTLFEAIAPYGSAP